MDQTALDAFLADQGLPPDFRRAFHQICLPLAQRVREWRTELVRPLVVGLCGAQGSGKSTIAEAVRRVLADEGLRAVTLSLDDLYFDRGARNALAADIPLLATRGPPGTHDVSLGVQVLDDLRAGHPCVLPRFDKGRDAPSPRGEWPAAPTGVDVVLFEGWCVGARPEPATRLARPVNDLERLDDADGRWRAYVNGQLAGPYQALFDRLDRLVLLQAPGFAVVEAWRAEQEAKLRTRTGLGMSDAEIGRFIAHYERLTRWILAEMPERADWAPPLDGRRTLRL